MHPLIIQIMNNFVILIIAMLIVSFIMRGFFWRFVRVKLSFGKLVLCKIRSVNRDHYKIGNISEEFLIYRHDRKNVKRIHIADKSVFYRSLGVSWVDIDETKNCLVKPDFGSIEGFDAVKFSDLYKRALYKPSISENEMYFKIMITLLIFLLIGIGISIFLNYQMYKQIGLIGNAISTLQKGTIIAAGGL